MCPLGKKFAVIFLPNETMYSEVPVAWLTPDKGHCWWPINSINANAVMVRGETPDVTTWNIHECSVERYCSTLESARRCASDPNCNSSASEGPTGRGFRKKILNEKLNVESDSSSTQPSQLQRKKKKKLSQKNYDSSDAPSDFSLPPSPMGMILSNNYEIIAKFDDQEKEKLQTGQVGTYDLIKVDPKKADPENAQENGATLQELKLSTLNLDASTLPDLGDQTPQNVTLQDVYSLLGKIAMTCRRNEKYLLDINNAITSLSFEKGSFMMDGNLNDLKKKLPLQSKLDIQNFDDVIQNENDFRKAYVAHMKSVGGKDYKENTNRCLALLFTNDLGVQCSWFGQRGNFELGCFSFMKIFVDIIVTQHTNREAKISDVEKHINEWFRLSKQRVNRKKNDGNTKKILEN